MKLLIWKHREKKKEVTLPGSILAARLSPQGSEKVCCVLDAAATS